MSESTPTQPNPRTHPPRLTFWGGGYILWLAAVLCLAVVAVRVSYWLPSLAGDSRAMGDGINVASYGFDLTNLTVRPDLLVASKLARDDIKALIDPPMRTFEEHKAALTGHIRMRAPEKFLVPSDRVIGVSIAGEHRAYPIRVLNWHEIVHDTVAGVPIAVTFSPWTDSAVVFDRRIHGRVMEFGHSGLLYNSNLVMYDRQPTTTQPAAGPSLWSQMLGRAIAGPLVGSELTPISCQLVTWERWSTRHPETLVLGYADEAKRERKKYREDPYLPYLADPSAIEFPASPLPAMRPGEPLLKEPCVQVQYGGQRMLYPFSVVNANADAAGRWQTSFNGLELTFSVARLNEIGMLSVAYPESQSPILKHGLWFAWYAMGLADRVATVAE